jgi:hypothetical protein
MANEFALVDSSEIESSASAEEMTDTTSSPRETIAPEYEKCQDGTNNRCNKDEAAVSKALEEDSREGETLQEFLLFPRLPGELRMMIWAMAINSLPGRVKEYPPVLDPPLFQEKFSNPVRRPKIILTQKETMAAYKASKDYITHQSWDSITPPQVEINPCTDVLWLHSPRDFRYLVWSFPGLLKDTAKDIRNIGFLENSSDGWFPSAGSSQAKGSEPELPLLSDIFPGVRTIWVLPEKHKDWEIVPEPLYKECSPQLIWLEMDNAKVYEMNQTEGPLTLDLVAPLMESFPNMWDVHQQVLRSSNSGYVPRKCPEIKLMHVRPRSYDERLAKWSSYYRS